MPISGSQPVIQVSESISMPFPNDRGVLKEGWLFKKRRKRIQGFASRYFKLHVSGLLSYSIHPSIAARDQIQLSTAVISSFSSSPCDVLIDSDYSTFHIKFKSIAESQQWMTLFRRFMKTSGELKVIDDILHDMELGIDELNRSLFALKQEENSLKSPNFFRLNVLKDRDNRLNKLFKAEHALSSRDSSPSEKEVRGDTGSRLDRISEAVRTVTSRYQLLVSSLAQIPDWADSRLQSPPRLGVDTLRSRATRPRSASVRTSLPASPSNESIFFDALDIVDGEEVVLETEPPDANPFPEASDSRPQTPHKYLEESLSEMSFTIHSESIIQRRTILPAPVGAGEGNLLTALKKNIGKDLSNVSFPVSFNEPISLLQRICEDVEYRGLLDHATSVNDPLEKLCYIAAFAVSGYGGTKLRGGRKAFTPMLGETFEDSRSNFIAEKVSHSPLVVACHAHGDGWEYWSTITGKTRFWGRSLEIIQTGTCHLRIGQDHFQWQRPSTFVRNLVVGTKYLEHCGQLTVMSSSEGLSCTLDFKETGYWGTSPNVVTGTINDASQTIVARLEGRWDEQLSRVLDEDHLKVLWKANPFPRHATEYYGFSAFTITLNEMTPDLIGRLPATDSRFRPDIRAMEEGQIEEAEAYKARLEQRQRIWREQDDSRIRPKWFEQVDGTEEYVYRGGYWEQKERGWPSSKPLWQL